MLPASLDADMKEYINGYLSDSPDIYSAEALAEFLAPILQNDDGLDEKQVQKLCESMAAVSVKATALKGGTDTAAAAASILLADGYHNANGDFDDGPRLLHRAITMNEEEAVSKLFSMTSSSGAGGDIRHTAGARSTQKSTVDEKKVRREGGRKG